MLIFISISYVVVNKLIGSLMAESTTRSPLYLSHSMADGKDGGLPTCPVKEVNVSDLGLGPREVQYSWKLTRPLMS